MEEQSWFLPPWPPEFGELVLIGALLVAGLLGGELASRVAALPRIVGYVLAGVAFGPHAADLARAPPLAAAVFAVARFLGKAVAILALGPLSGLRTGGAGLLSVALLPMSALAVVMVQDTMMFFPRFGAQLAAVVLPAVAPLALLGPLATQYALNGAGEAHPEAYEKEETGWNSGAPKARRSA
jgi:hypothetical protein